MKMMIGLLLCGMIFIPFLAALAQQGAWIEYSITPFGTGSRSYFCGENCIGYTHENATKMIFFDISNSEWIEASFAASQHFNAMLANGNVVFAYSDSFLVGFNGITSQWDTVRFEGTPLNPSGSGVNRSYQCGTNIALFVTDQKFYIYDVSVDHWLSYEYIIPADYSGVGYYWASDDYAAVLLYRTNQGVPTNLVYSSHFHDFNQTARGAVWGGQDVVKNGYGGLYPWVPGIDCFLVGYSALTNQFTHVDIDSSCTLDIAYLHSESYFEDMTVYEVTARKTIIPYELVRYDVWCWDTRRATWSNHTFELDPTENPGFGGWMLGGRFATAYLAVGPNEPIPQFFYSGFTGDIFTLTTGIYEQGHTLIMEGGTVAGLFDTLNAFGYDVETGLGALYPITRQGIRHHVTGEHYLAINRYDYTDISTTYFYHGPSNSWSSIELTNVTGGVYYAGQYAYAVRTSGTNSGVCFYSPILNEIDWAAFPSGSSITLNGSRYMVSASAGGGSSKLYDSRLGIWFDFDCTFGLNSIGDHVALIANTSTNTFYGYSSTTGTVTPLAVGSTPHRSNIGDYVGLGYIGDSGTNYYAFNSFYGNYVELVPLGNYVGQKVGGKTAIVVRSNKLYAFDPEAPVAADDDPAPILPAQVELYQNYPNPFNAATVISYSLPGNSDVTLKIYDLLGRLVREFSFEDQPAGKHAVTWDSADNASGVYFYKIEAGKYSDTKRMVLVK